MKTFEENIIGRLQLLDREVERLRVKERPIGGGTPGESITLTAGLGLTGGGDLSANRRFDVGAGAGIAVGTDDVRVDLSYNFAWSGVHSFQNITYASSIMPHVSDVYDLGSSASLWRKIWGSELSAIVFAKYEQVLLGGWFTVSKGEGTLPWAINNTQTQINLGASTFATNDILVFRGISSTNSPQVEYMKVGTLVSGTTYNVTRNLDGTGANSWPSGTVFGNWGTTGNGRIELNAYDTPRLSVFSHGAAIADFREQVRIGDLINGWGYGSSIYGGAFGSYEVGKANITIDPTNGVRIRNYNQTVIQLTGTEASFENVIKLGAYGRLQQGTGTWGTNFTGSAIWSEGSPAVMNIGGWNNNVKQWWGGSDGTLYAGQGDLKINNNGITIVSPSYYGKQDRNNIKWHKPADSLTILFNIGNWHTEDGNTYSRMSTNGISGKQAVTYVQSVGEDQNATANVTLLASISDASNASLELSKSSSVRTLAIQVDNMSLSGGGFHVGGTSAAGAGNLVVDGTIKDGSGVEYLKTTGKAADSDKLDGIDSTGFGRPVFLTTPLTSTDWEGNARSTTAKTLIDLSAVFGVPAGVKAIMVQLLSRDSASAVSTTVFFGVSPNNTDASCPVMSVSRGLPNDTLVYASGICPCDANGDIYYQVVASGTDTTDCWIRIWGYWL